MNTIKGVIFVGEGEVKQSVSVELATREGKKGLSGKIGNDQVFAFPADGKMDISMKFPEGLKNIGTLNASANAAGEVFLDGELTRGSYAGPVRVCVISGAKLLGNVPVVEAPVVEAPAPVVEAPVVEAPAADAEASAVESTQKRRPDISGYGYREANNKDSRFDLALWKLEGKAGYAGKIGDKEGVLAYRDTVKKDGSPASENAPLSILERNPEGKLVPFIDLYPNRRSSKPRLFNAEKDVYVTITGGFELVGLAAPAKESEVNP